MQFSHTLDKVLSGEKVLTSRLVKPGEYMSYGWRELPSEDNPNGIVGNPIHVRTEYHVRYSVGKTYAVQPGRGKPAVARIRVLAIKRYDVRDITWGEASAEGFYSPFDFLALWTQIHDKRAWNAQKHTDFSDGDESGIIGHGAGWKSWLKGTRPAERYDAWQIRFELVSPRTRMDEPTGWSERDVRELGFNKLLEGN